MKIANARKLTNHDRVALASIGILKSVNMLMGMIEKDEAIMTTEPDEPVFTLHKIWTWSDEQLAAQLAATTAEISEEQERRRSVLPNAA